MFDVRHARGDTSAHMAISVRDGDDGLDVAVIVVPMEIGLDRRRQVLVSAFAFQIDLLKGGRCDTSHNWSRDDPVSFLFDP